MFFTSSNSTTPVIQFQMPCDDNIVWSNNYCLHNGLILAIGMDEKRTKTIMQLISPNDNRLVTTKTLTGHYDLIAHFTNDTLL